MAQHTVASRTDFQPIDSALPAIPAQASTHPENTTKRDLTLGEMVVAIRAAVDQAMRTTLPGHYSPEIAERIANEMIARLSQRDDEPQTCPMYRDCEDREPGHTDHYNHGLRVTGEDGSTILDAGMVALSGSETAAIVYVRNEELTDATSVRAKTAELRGFLDQVDAMADRVFQDHQTNS
ncbi:hypothetical protein E2C11_11035 [Streptomyces lavendulae]|nr:hypothetical protein [Streptomyces lavendulae]TXJ80675.1 hypothetical protein E2C11_11035 [Streptomyces lavendulae]